MFQTRFVTTLTFATILLALQFVLLNQISTPLMVLIFFTLSWTFWVYCYFLKRESQWTIFNMCLILLMNFVIYLLINTNSILSFLFLYESLMLPSVLLVWSTSYTTRRTIVTSYFLFWTQFGSLLVIFGSLILFSNNIFYFS